MTPFKNGQKLKLGPRGGAAGLRSMNGGGMLECCGGRVGLTEYNKFHKAQWQAPNTHKTSALPLFFVLSIIKPHFVLAFKLEAPSDSFVPA